MQSGPASLPAEDISTNSNGPKQDSLFDDDPEDLFAGTHMRAHTHTHTHTHAHTHTHTRTHAHTPQPYLFLEWGGLNREWVGWLCIVIVTLFFFIN